jgi:hypothetical protein
MTRTNLDWPEVNCILEAIQALIEKYQAKLAVEKTAASEGFEPAGQARCTRGLSS